MAEGIFMQLVMDAGLGNQIGVDSAGTASYHIGAPPDKRTMLVCKEKGIPLNHKGRAIQRSDFETFDYIIPMDKENRKNLLQIRPKQSKAKVLMLGEMKAPNHAVEIPDPYYGGIEGFYGIYDMLKEELSTLLDFIAKNESDHETV